MKMPPREKIHEALTAIIDERINPDEENNKAEVFSSDQSKKYLVEWHDNEYSSNDNATYWQGYPGYPVIAVLLLQGKLCYDQNILNYFKGINWKKINEEFKRDYAKAVESIYEGIDQDKVVYIEKEINRIYEDLGKLEIVIKKGRQFPPK
jgi:hypothetical protein